MILNKNNFYKYKYNFYIENEQVMTFYIILNKSYDFLYLY